MVKLPRALWPKPDRYGLVVAMDENGTLLSSLHDPSGDHLRMVTSALPHDGKLYLGSLETTASGCCRCHEGPAMKPLLAALALAVMLPASASEVVFRVDEAGNLDLDAARLQQLLADPRVEVSAHYAPLIAIPGWTGRFGLCRGPSICLKNAGVRCA